MIKVFNQSELNKLYKPASNSTGEDNGQVTIIGGSELFHGAPILALKVASRIVDMVFFSSPEKSIGHIAETMKSKLMSFIWVPWEEIENYIEKSDAVLIGPGFKRYKSELRIKNHELRSNALGEDGELSRKITERLLKQFPKKKWVIDAGSLHTMEADWIPKGSILTPNRKEFEMLFGSEIRNTRYEIQGEQDRIASLVLRIAKKHKCVIVLKGSVTMVALPEDVVIVKGGNAGMTKGGTGDVLSCLTVLFVFTPPQTLFSQRSIKTLYITLFILSVWSGISMS